MWCNICQVCIWRSVLVHFRCPMLLFGCRFKGSPRYHVYVQLLCSFMVRTWAFPVYPATNAKGNLPP